MSGPTFTGAVVLPADHPALARIAALEQALRDLVDRDFAYMGADAETGNPQSLYQAIRRARALVGV